MSQEGSDRRTLKTVSRAIEIVDVLAQSGSIGVTELARQLGLSKSTVHTYLKTLEVEGFVTRDGDEYQIAYELMLLGESVRNQHVLYRTGRSEIDELAAKVGQYAHLTIEENGRCVNLYQARSDTAVSHDYQSAKLFQRDYLHVTAAGKAILAYLSRKKVTSILDQHGLPQHTPQTITDRKTLYEELDTIRERGYAFNDEEEVNGFRAVGAPVLRPDGEVLGSLSVSGPTSVLDDDRFYEEIPDAVTHAANVIEVSMNMSSKYNSLSETID